jgi:HTH-type transcriptional regulator/antitoxin HigA
MKAKILKSEADYEAALAHIETLMDAAPGSPEEEELSLFALLVEQYEREHYPIAPPDPIDAILFRMDQQGLTRADLVPYIGSQSKVSEVLRRKRPLSIAMIRNLHEGLGIPAATLLQSPDKELVPAGYDPQDYPIKEMLQRGYFAEWSGKLRETKQQAEELLEKFFAVFGSTTPQQVYCRRTENEVNDHALRVWQARALHMIQGRPLPPYVADALDEAFFKRIARASYFPHGPTLVESLLNERGIHFVLLEHLPQTYLDGACFISPQGEPVIGMTLRHDRMDNFWFTLAHELGHLHLHLPDDELAFFDDTDRDGYGVHDPREGEANAFARNVYISPSQWLAHGQALIETGQEEDILALAEQLEISPAIVAGRIRWESGNYTRFAKLVNSGKARELFPDFKKC